MLDPPAYGFPQIKPRSVALTKITMWRLLDLTTKGQKVFFQPKREEPLPPPDTPPHSHTGTPIVCILAHFHALVPPTKVQKFNKSFALFHVLLKAYMYCSVTMRCNTPETMHAVHSTKLNTMHLR